MKTNCFAVTRCASIGLVAVLGFINLNSGVASGALIPYYTDFEDSTVGSTANGFASTSPQPTATAAGTGYTVVDSAGDLVYRAFLGKTSGTATKAINTDTAVSGLEPAALGNDFTVTASATFNSAQTSIGNLFGIRILAASSLSTADYYLLDVRPTDGQARITRFRTGSSSSTTSSTVGTAFVPGRTYDFTIDVSYNSLGHLSIAYTVDDNMSYSKTVNLGPDTNPNVGQYVGFRTFLGGEAPTDSSALTVDWNYINVVPEPSAAVLALFASSCLGLVQIGRKRRSAK